MPKKILFLYTEMAGYMESTIEEISSKGYQVDVVMWSKNKLTPYLPNEIKNVKFFGRDKINFSELKMLHQENKYKLIYVSGWQDKQYLRFLFYIKNILKDKTPIICGFDDQWLGTCKQKIGSFLMRSFVRKLLYTHAWVAGPFQFEYARKMGFERENIIFGLLSCDSFYMQNNVINSEKEFEFGFIYVGSFTKIKGFQILLDAFKSYKTDHAGKYKLVCIGQNIDFLDMNFHEDILVLPYSSKEVIREYASRSMVFIYPSILDQWGVAVQEFGLMGKPIIVSESVGARTSFVINGFNGYVYSKNDSQELSLLMLKMEKEKINNINKMGENSKILAESINSEISAANFLSVIK